MSEPSKDEETWLLALGAIVSDGGAVDWDEAERRASTTDQRQLVAELRRVAGVIKAHGSSPAREPADAPATEPIVPAVPSGHWRHLLLFECLGQGAFGDVYRAWDPQLDRDVAVKLIARAAERVESPLTEARHLARVRHPHVVTVYGADQDAEQAGIWMEFIQGQTLADMVRHRGPMSPRETVGIGLDLCAALSAIHHAGLVHRDIKAENVMRERGGRIVLMDFSGAGAFRPGETPQTLTGTPLYMAPELFRGSPPSAVTDVYSLGVLLFFLLTGSTPVDGLTADEVKQAHGRGERKRLRDLRADVPDPLVHVVERATASEAARRLHSAGELGEALANSGSAAAPDGSIDPPTAPVPRWWTWPIWMPAAALLAILAGITLYTRPPLEPPPPILRFRINQPLVTGSWPRLSPDGRYVVYGTIVEGRNRLYIQPLDTVQGHPLLDTSADETPFWSPDSRTVGFFEGGKLKLVSVDGGDAQTVADAPIPHGGSWSGRTILYARADGIYRVDATAGTPTLVVPLDRGQGDYQHGWPEFLPGGRYFLFVVRSSDAHRTGLYLGDLASGSSRRLGPAYSRTAYADGHIFYVRNGALITQTFDPRTFSMGDHATVVTLRVQAHTTNDAAFDVTETGRLIYFSPAGHLQTRLVLVDRQGRELRELAARGAHSRPRVSPDGHQVVAERLNPGETSPDLWVYSVDEPGAQRLTREASPDVSAAWSPDGRQVAFSSKRGTVYDVYVKTINGIADEVPLPVVRVAAIDEDDKLIEDWTDDGKTVAVSVLRDGLWLLPFDRDARPVRLHATSAAIRWHASFAPGHHWMAYTSEESGQRQVYVEPLPATGDRWKVSAYGGGEPHWGRDDRELYYLDTKGDLMAVVRNGSDWSQTRTVRMFDAHVAKPTEGANFSPMPDGRGFVVNRFVEEGAIPPIEVVIGWPQLLER